MLNVYTICPTEYFGSNCYLVGDEDDWVVIDPSVSYEKALKKYPEIEGKIRYVLLTHGHFDHIYAIDSWVTVCDQVVVGAEDAAMLSDPQLNCYLGFMGIRGGYFGKYSCIRDGDVLKLTRYSVRAIATPGHTPGGMCYKISDVTFVGDTLFSNGGYGRCDLPGGNEDELWRSLFKLFSANMIGKFYPGHGFNDTFENSIKYFK